MRKGLVALLLGGFVTAASAQDGPRVLRVRFGDGTPAAGTLVVPCRGHDTLPWARCDAEGVVTLADARTADRVVLFDPPPVLCAVPLSTDATELVVPLVRLAGRVLIDGAPPRQPLELALDPDVGDSLSRIGPIPGVGGPLLRALSTRTDASGAFDFGLVLATLSGQIQGPRTLEAIAPPAEPGYRTPILRGRSVSFDRAAPDLVLEFHALPLLSGRVVDAEGRPLAGSRVEYEFTNEASSGSGGGNSGVPVDGDARFAVPLDAPPMRRAVLRLIGPTGTGRRTLTLDPVPEEGRDLGDIALAANEPLLVEARDTQGRPLQGAIVLTLDGRVRSEPTGPDGRVVFRERVAGDDSVQVAALAHETVTVRAQAAPGEPVVAVLPELSTIEVDVRLPDGRPAPQVVLALFCQQGIFATGSTPWVGSLQVQLGASHLLGSSHTARALLPEGHALITGLRPGAQVQARLVDRCGAPLCDEVTITIGERERTMQLWPLARLPRDVRIEARDPDGRIVPKVGVIAECLDATDHDEQGRFMLRDLYGDELAFEVRPRPESGFGRTPFMTRPIPADGIIVVDLVPARTLVVEIVDEAGVAVDGSPRVAGFGRVDLKAQRVAPGRFEFRGLGAALLDMTVHLCDQAWKRQVDTADGVARFVVPRTGQVRIRLARAIAQDEEWFANFVARHSWAGARALPTTGLAEGAVIDLGAFLPGDYRGWLTRGVGPSPWPEGAPVSVTAGETTEVVLP